MKEYIDILIEEGLIDNNPLSTEKIEHIDENLYLIRDKSTNDGFVDILVCLRYEKYKKIESDFYSKIVNQQSYNEENKDKSNILDIYMVYDNWESERDDIQSLIKDKRIMEKKRIEDNFASFNSIYVDNQKIELIVEGEGINYLTSPEDIEKDELSGIVVNCSFFELKKLYNVTGNKLFKNNVRDGIRDNKSKLKEIFRKYISLDEDEILENNEYKKSLFWYSHNGITIFVDNNDKDNFRFYDNSISVNPKSLSVINGAQTITNFFIVYSDLIHEYKAAEEEKNKNEIGKEGLLEKQKQRLEIILKETFVKLTIISGKQEYTKFITRGLNTQTPITDGDFVAISKEVEDINKEARGTIHIMKTGETRRRGYFTPLEFVKNYLIVKSKPGESKNFNKNNLDKKIKEIHGKLDGNFISDAQKISFLIEVDEWWRYKQKNNNKNSDKISQLINKYGKNYFQSFTLKFYEELTRLDNINNKLESIYDNFLDILKEIIDESENEITYNIFKNNTKFNELIKKYDNKIETANKTIENIKNYNKEILDYLNKLPDGYDSRNFYKEIYDYNKAKQINVEGMRIIVRRDNKIKEHFHLSTRTFSEIYQSVNIEEKLNEYKDLEREEFPKFEESILYEELKRSYNIYLIEIIDDKIKSVKYSENFDFELIKDHKDDVKKLFEATIDAFLEGESSMFPKANKDNIIHVRPKAQTKDDSFLFTNGEELTKRTFWITKYYIDELLNRLEDEK